MRQTPLHRLAAIAAVLGAIAGTGVLATSGSGQGAPDKAAAAVVKAAREHIGEAYRWGGAGPKEWDCSGLVYALWRQVGDVDTVPRVSRDQQAWAWPLDKADTRPGDLVFFGDPVTHVGILIGRGKMIDASSANEKVLERTVWTSDVVRYGRVPRKGVPHPLVSKNGVPRTTAALAGIRRLGVVPKASQVYTGKLSRKTSLFVTQSRKVVGRPWAKGGHGPSYDAAGLVRWAWASSGHGVLPRTPGAIERLTHPVALKDLRPGDLVFYGLPAVHVGVYVGNGQMVDSSKAVRKVLLRPVFLSDTVRFARLR